MEIYTWMTTPFAFGGKGHFVKTEVEEYERIKLRHGYWGILAKNPLKDLWHLAEESCGAIIGTAKSRKEVLAKVLEDMDTGSKDIMEEQIESGEKQRENAKLIPSDRFFEAFKEG